MLNSSFNSATQTIRSNISTHTFNEKGWVVQIRKTLEEQFEEDNNEIPVSIFSVPTTLICTNPDAYIPQQVAIGPYHHWRQELYEMERYKIAAARRTVKHLACFDTFQQIVDQLQVLEPRIRASYHKYLNLSGETLAWMMAIDVSFLLEFLEVYARKEGKLLCRGTSRLTSNLVDAAGRKSAHIAVLRDILMLENQIPMFFLRKMLELELGSLDAADEMLLSMLRGLSIELYPFKTPEELPMLLIEDSAHILDFFYRLLMPKAFRTSQITEGEESYGGNEEEEEITIDEESQSKVLKFFNVIWKSLSNLNIHPVRLFKALLNSKLLKVLLKMPWTIITKLPVLNMLKEPIENIFMRKDKEDLKPENDSVVRPPLIEELAIPSVTVLSKAGVRFVPTDGGICSTQFDVKTHTLSLPRVNLDVNTDIIMRNMVAYESCNAAGPLVFTRYTEFMNGIVDTADDAKFLRERGIILNRLKSDEEVANFCNGMSRSVKLTKVPFLDKVVEDVNKYYNGRWKVKAAKCFRSYVYGSWRILTVLACIMLLGLMALQTVCSVYSCARVIQQYASTDESADQP
ncbi:putative Transmembrane protein [Heracleum sosnowskyi]|uniref:Transmembrane protein n=1 Tax=Heracleum sosnowskyi TaxID=360622 RepID=A0AAD8JBV9_9APIA|nr:putative Transmembrane protein [Heracleum sosnowskyi]